ncbi:MAG: LamG-like jellyroll fold domain-containing protein, partial [Snowella sp.]
RIWNTARTQAQIQANLNTQLTGNEAGLAGYWNFDQPSNVVAEDVSLNSNNGQLSNGASLVADNTVKTPQQIPYPVIIDNSKLQVANIGATEFSLNLDGNDDYVSIAHNPSLSLTTFTIELWVKQVQIKGNWQPLITKSNNSGDNENYGIYIWPNESRLQFEFKDTNGNWAVYNSQGSLTLNQLTHVAATYDGSEMRLYLNGQLDGSVSYVGTPIFSTEPVNIGRVLNAYTSFAGQIDDVRIWNTARTQAQIQANLNTQLTGNEPGLAGYWNFDQASNAVADDVSLNSNNGQLFNGASLLADNAVKNPQQIIYTVTDLPSQGGLTRNSVALKVGDTFTQADIDSQFVSYKPNSTTPTSDSFKFTVTDGITTQTNQTFQLRGNPTAVSGEFLVNTTTAKNQIDPSVTAFTDGGFIVVWASENATTGGSIYGQRYDVNQQKVGTEFLISTDTNYSLRKPVVTNLPNGGYVVAWYSDRTNGTEDLVLGQVYNAQGVAVGTTFQLSTGLTDNAWFAGVGDVFPLHHLDVKALADGTFLVAWNNHNNDYNG